MTKTLTYITGNEGKLKTAQTFLSKFEIEIVGLKLPINEIQSESIEEISQDKAKKAFALANKPIFVNDTGWYIEALGGFPGPFMAFINKWLQPQDLLSLMSNQSNRTVVMKQVVTYKDQNIIKTFEYDSKGVILPELRGNTGNMVDKIISLSESGLSIAQEKDNGNYQFNFEKHLWNEFGEWIKNQKLN
jgi:XTP/dITP diphosphohydrolase